MANTWQGEFPWIILGRRVRRYGAGGSFRRTATGSTRWRATCGSGPRLDQEHKEIPQSCCVDFNPRGGERTENDDPHMTDIKIPRKVMKGGSHLCAPKYAGAIDRQRVCPSPSILRRIIWDFRCIVRETRIRTWRREERICLPQRRKACPERAVEGGAPSDGRGSSSRATDCVRTRQALRGPQGERLNK